MNTIRDFYTGATPVTYMDRSSLKQGETLALRTTLQKGDSSLIVPSNTPVNIKIQAIKSGGKTIEKADWPKYVDIAPTESILGENGASFVLTAIAKEAEVVLIAESSIVLPDQTFFTLKSSDFTINISPTYYLPTLSQSGVSLVSIDTTNPIPATIRIDQVLANGTVTPTLSPLSIEILDDVSGAIVYSGSAFNPTRDSLPLDVTKKV